MEESNLDALCRSVESIAIDYLELCSDDYQQLDQGVWGVYEPICEFLREELSAASTPEPPPERGDRDVPQPLIAFLEDQGYHGAADLVRDRVAFGEQKYGTRLKTDNGRDPIEDARQEIGDALQYLAQAKMEGRDLRELNDLVLGSLLAALEEYSG